MAAASRMALLACCSLLLPVTALGKTWHIAVDHSGDAPTIQAAIESCAEWDTILVGPGTYVENLNFLGKNLWAHSASGPELTIINGSTLAESAVRFITGELPTCVFEGFTVSGGSGHGDCGGGIYIDNSSPTIRNNIIQENHARFGGGVYVTSPSFNPALVSPLIDGNKISSNSAEQGGGLYAHYADAVITHNLFVGNNASYCGGGACLRSASPVLSFNQFRGNVAKLGGGLNVAYGSGNQATIVSFNLFAQNTATGDAVYGSGGGAAFQHVFVRIENNTFVENHGRSSTNGNAGGGLASTFSRNSEVIRNIIARNDGGGLYCRGDDFSFPTTYTDNLIWANTDQNFVNGDYGGCGELGDSWLIADPEFCGAGSGDYSVATTSPALGPGGPMGAFTEPGCGPVATRESTWGQLKARAWKPGH